MGPIEEDEEHADIEGLSIKSGNVLENLGAKFTVIGLDWSPEKKNPKGLAKADLNRLIPYTLATMFIGAIEDLDHDEPFEKVQWDRNLMEQ